MFDLFDNNDIDDEIPDFDHSDAPKPPRENATEALALIALETALTRKSRAVLKRHPSVIIVQLPHEDWAESVAAAIKRMTRAPAIRTVTERVKKGGVFHRVGGDDLKYLSQGRSILYISQDPEELLDEAILAAADVTIPIPALTPAVLRKIIRRVTGGVARGVTAEMAALDLPVITSVVRQDLTARQCVDNLLRAIARKPRSQVSSGPLLSALPLTDGVRKWTTDVLADLSAVETGVLPPDQLVFGVLEGPPGTGKTLIAESLARTAGWSFVPTSVGTWFTSGDGALGGVARNLKSFIDQILASEPAIGFMDEIDALPNRQTMDNRGRDWWTPIINLFLTEIDRLKKSNRKVLLLGATNYFAHLDNALIRPGRLQRRVSVLPPQTEDEVIALMRYYLKDDLADVDLSRLGRVGRGATPGMVEGWLKEARSEARNKSRPLELDDILGRMVPKDDRTPADIRAIALHEIGHAVVAHRLGQIVESVSIIPEGTSGGRTWTKLSTIIPTWERLLDLATVMLGGRAADIVLGAGANAGAEGDLASATELVLAAHQRQGLRDSLVFAPVLGIRSTATFRVVNAELHRLLKRAMVIVEADRDLAVYLADRLIEERVLSGNDIVSVLGTQSTRPVLRNSSRTRKPKALLLPSKPRRAT